MLVLNSKVWSGRKQWLGSSRTEDMNRPNAPPSAKPITPDITVFPAHDSIVACIYVRVSAREEKRPSGGQDEIPSLSVAVLAAADYPCHP